MDRLTPEMIRVIHFERERRAERVRLTNAVKAARKQADDNEQRTTLAKVLGYLSLRM